MKILLKHGDEMLEVFWDNLFKSDKNDLIRTIKTCPLFSTLTTSELHLIQRILHKRNYITGEIIFQPDSGTGMYIILKGQVNILHGTPEDESNAQFVSSLKEEDFFGELALTQSKGYQNIFAVSTKQTQLLAFYQPDLDTLIDSYPQIALKILKELCHVISQRLQRAEQKILQAQPLKK